MARDGDYVRDLASTVNMMFAEGHKDPSASEIAHRNFGDKTLGGEIVEGVRKRLTRIRKLLEEDYGHQVCPLGRTYYTRFRRKTPATRAEARRCLPLGHGMRQEGLHLFSGTDDLVWKEWNSLNGASGAAKAGISVNGVLNAYQRGQLSQADAAELIADVVKHAEPENPELAARVMRALPSPEDEGESQAV